MTADLASWQACASGRCTAPSAARVKAGRRLVQEQQHGVWDVLDRHPWLTQMPMAAPPVAPNSLIFVELGLRTLDGTGLADADKLRVIGLLSSYTLSEARMASDAARAAQAQAQAVEAGAGPARPWTFDALLRELVDEKTYPILHRIAWSQDAGQPSEREEFLLGIDVILDGVQALIERAREH